MIELDKGEILRFVVESNAIECITREPTELELEHTHDFLQLKAPKIEDVTRLVQTYTGGAPLRDRPDLVVSFGGTPAPRGGPYVVQELKDLLRMMWMDTRNPHALHHEYETLHPYMDGNGRSGRALWAWGMLHHGYPNGISLGFLHAWYYQSLNYARVRRL